MLNATSVPVYLVAAWLLAGCFNNTLQQKNQQQLEHQQTELSELKQQVEALETQRLAYSPAPSSSGSCDPNIMREATLKGGALFAASDFSGALSYYQDALTACPNNARANLNLARTYEAVGDRAEAVAHYRLAANAGGTEIDPEAVRDARSALNRLGG